MKKFILSVFCSVTFVSLLVKATNVPKNSISSHVLDTSLGKPAGGIQVLAFVRNDLDEWERIGSTFTNLEGRVDWVSPGRLNQAGVYRLLFRTAEYYTELNIETFYPWAEIVFIVTDPNVHYHVPLTLSPFGYSTYRGS